MSSRSRHSRRTLPTQRSAWTLRVPRLDGRADHRNSFASEDVIAATAELGVAIVDQEADRLLAIIDGHQQVARLLGDPGACWVRRAGDEFDQAALERDEKST